MLTKPRMLKLSALLLLAVPTVAAAEDPVCPDPCTPDPQINLFGVPPVGSELTFEFHTVTPGNAYTVIDLGTWTPICSTCTPCKAVLKFEYKPNGSATQACYSPDGGGTWVATPSDVLRNIQIQTNCNALPQQIQIDIAHVGVPCGQSPIFFATAQLLCHCDA
jgi:hypothetical protein